MPECSYILLIPPMTPSATQQRGGGLQTAVFHGEREFAASSFARPRRAIDPTLPKPHPAGKRNFPLAARTRMEYDPRRRARKAERPNASGASIDFDLDKQFSRRETAKRRFGAGFEQWNALVRSAPPGASSACFVPKALGRAFCGDIPEARLLSLSPSPRLRAEHQP